MSAEEYHIYGMVYDNYERIDPIAEWYIGDFSLNGAPHFSIQETLDHAANLGYGTGEWKVIEIKHLNDDGTGPTLAYIEYWEDPQNNPYSEWGTEGNYWKERGIYPFSSSGYMLDAWGD